MNIEKLIDDYGKTTVEKLTTDWLELQRGTTKKQTTFDRKEQVVKYQVIKYIGKIQVATLDSAKIQKWLNDLADDSYGICRRIYGRIKIQLKIWIIKRLCERGISNPLEFLKKTKSQ